MNVSYVVWIMAMGSFVWGGCTHQQAAPRVSGGSEQPYSQEQGQEMLSDNAKARRTIWKDKPFSEFEAQVYKEPFEGGKYIVNGDTAFSDVKHLQEFFETRIKDDGGPGGGPVKLTVHQVDGQDAAWNSTEKRQLTYCVSTTFGDRHAQVVSDLQAATAVWEAVADVDFIHVSGQDGSCTASTASVMFDVNPVNVNGQYLARAFFPNEPRASRNVLVDESAFTLDPNGQLSLQGVLRHELGHALGFRHEHTRPDSGICFEDTNWRPLTSYDAFSVMHYPQCNGKGDWSLTLSPSDQSGAACLYGPADGFTIDTAICEVPEPVSGPVACGPKTESFVGQQVARNAWQSYGPFPVAPGTIVEVVMHGEANPGDPDLYVRFNQNPETNNFHCRPYLSGAEETCALDVPADAETVHVRVRGYTVANFNLTVTHTPEH